MKKINLKNMTLSELEIYFETIGEKKFRAKQILQWMMNGAYDFDEMTNIKKELREKLIEVAFIENITIEKVQNSNNNSVKKYLFLLQDGMLIESVFMKYKHGNSVCVSSQAGCRMGCYFCASAIYGLTRNLSRAEMLEQVITIEKDNSEKISNVVVMGIGEPFDNYENVAGFIDMLHSKDGMGKSMRNITVSTCGIVPKIIDFAKEYPQVNLAISLHAPNDNIRERLMPINKAYNIEKIIEACKKYLSMTSRRITFEYTLISGINDSSANAKELVKLLKGLNCHVNLISFNRVSEASYKGSSKEVVESFREILDSSGITVTVRRELGAEIDAACGQLRLINK